MLPSDEFDGDGSDGAELLDPDSVGVCATCGLLPTPTDYSGTHCRRCENENWVPAVG
ncbi:MAG: hypothetical protein H7Z21_11245 [Hymenobacter sp.]|nr:hypothetical protein [Hymenobacter sp.]